MSDYTSGWQGDPMTNRFRIIEDADCALYGLPTGPWYLILCYSNGQFDRHFTWLVPDRQRWEDWRRALETGDEEWQQWNEQFGAGHRFGWPEEWAAPDEVFPWQAWAD